MMALVEARQERRLAIIKMLMDGLTYAEIGKRLGGISYQRVQQLAVDPSYRRDARARRLERKRSASKGGK